jgi:SRSO17 transposase
VSLSVATRSAHIPIDFELYLPESWTSDPERRKECRIPDNVVFKTKEDLALDMIDRAVANKLPGDIVLADSWYGRSQEFRAGVRLHGFDYALGISPTLRMCKLDKLDRKMGEAQSAREIAAGLGEGAFRKITWRDGTMNGRRGKLSARFAIRRVMVENGSEAEWLLIERQNGDGGELKFALTTLARSMSKKQIVRLYKERYRTEQVYQEMKGELGLDHFEGRSFIGWHHHVSVAICCYAFVVGERMRHFPPEAGRRSEARANELAA